MVGAVVAIVVLGSLCLAAVAYMEWVGVMSLFGPHGTVRELLDGQHDRTGPARLGHR